MHLRSINQTSFTPGHALSLSSQGLEANQSKLTWSSDTKLFKYPTTKFPRKTSTHFLGVKHFKRLSVHVAKRLCRVNHPKSSNYLHRHPRKGWTKDGWDHSPSSQQLHNILIGFKSWPQKEKEQRCNRDIPHHNVISPCLDNLLLGPICEHCLHMSGAELWLILSPGTSICSSFTTMLISNHSFSIFTPSFPNHLAMGHTF